jgi:ABC-2 type transport system permease protein
MSAARTLATARRVLLQLRHDPRTIALMLLVPCVLETLLRLIYAHHRAAFDQAGAPLLAFFPLTTVFLVTSIALLRERVTGTLERLLTSPLGRLELLGGYTMSFGLFAAAQAIVVSAVALGPLGLRVQGPVPLPVVLAVCVALLGTGLSLLASAFARTEFQVVQFFPLIILPQLLLCGLLVARNRMPSVLHAISDALPLSYAVDGMHHLSRHVGAGEAVTADIAIVLAFAAGALVLGAATLRRQNDRASPASGEDDLAAGGQPVELADGDDVLYLWDEVVLGQTEHVDRCLAGIQTTAGVGDHLDELGDRRDVQFLHLGRELVGDDPGHAREAAGPGRQVEARIADGGDLDVVVLGLVDRIQSEEGEE